MQFRVAYVVVNANLLYGLDTLRKRAARKRASSEKKMVFERFTVGELFVHLFFY